MKVVGCFFLRLPLYNKVVHAADALAGSVAEVVNAATVDDFGADIVSDDLVNVGNDVDVVMLLLLMLLFLLLILLLIVLLRL